MNQDICYDKTWTENEIQKIENELNTLSDLNHLVCNAELENSNNYLIRNYVQQLEISLQSTKKALQSYINSMESKLLQMNTYFEDELQKSNDLFSNS